MVDWLVELSEAKWLVGWKWLVGCWHDCTEATAKSVDSTPFPDTKLPSNPALENRGYLLHVASVYTKWKLSSVKPAGVLLPPLSPRGDLGREQVVRTIEPVTTEMDGDVDQESTGYEVRVVRLAQLLQEHYWGRGCGVGWGVWSFRTFEKW